jgi:hypothetical protein
VNALRRTLPLAALAALGLALGACPLPQPVPNVGRTVDGGAVTTAIILPESAQPPDTTVLVKPDCPAPDAAFTLSATVEDTDTTDDVVARWFVDYRPEILAGFVQEVGVPASGDPNDPLRAIPPFTFRPYDFGTPAVGVPLHVVEVAVSNNFLPVADPTPPRQRAAPPPFQTQVYRWVFQYVDKTDPRGRCQ